MNKTSSLLRGDGIDARIKELQESLVETDDTPLTLASDLVVALVDGERRYHHLMEKSAAFICVHDLNGVLVSVNKAVTDALGYRRGDMVGQKLSKFLAPDSARGFGAYLKRMSSAAGTGTGTMVVRGRDGGVRTWSYRNSRFDEPGQEPCVIGHAQDITELKQLEQTLQLTQFSVDKAADSVFWIAADGGLRYVNDAACDYLGYSQDELLSLSIVDIDVTLDRADWPTHWEQVKQLSRFTTETIYRTKDGRKLPVEVTINFLSFHGQEYHCVFAREISERKEAEDALIAMTARLEGLIENLQAGILFEGDDRRVVLANQTLCQMLDIPIPPRALTGADSRTLLEQCQDMFPEPSAFLSRVDKILKAHEPVRNEELTLRDGRVFARDFIPIVNQSYRAHLWQYRDVTERKNAEAEILGAKFEAEKANAAKSSFLAMMSHELRTPLNAILGMTELSFDTELSDEQSEFLRTIQSNSENLLRLIDDVLDLSKIEANRMELELIAFDPKELVEEVAESLSFRATSKNVELVLFIDPHLPSKVIGDPKRVRQILLNLVGNAVKFTEKGSVEISLKVADWKPGGRVELGFAVTDTGIGIPVDKQERLFSKFYQAESSTTRKFGGTGLGLNISRSLVELMGGRIDFVSEPGQGSTFRVNIATDAPTDTEPNSTRHRALLAESKATVLLYIDNEKRRRSLEQIFVAWGLDVEVSSSFEEVEQKLMETSSPKLAVFEHRPEKVDLDVLRRLRHPPLRELLLLTSLGSSTSTVLAETCPNLVVKPTRQGKLAEALGRALGLRSQTLSSSTAEPITAVAPEEARPRFRILLVEDNADNKKLAERVLASSGAKVDTAENGEEAVSLSERTLYDLIVMDLMMPVMDGFTATEEIRKGESAPNRVPIVALTAHATEGFRERCLDVGMDDYLSKPFKKERFLAVVDQWVDRRPIILVADDAPENRLIVKRFLMLSGDYRLLFASDGREAIAVFERHDVALVLLDMEMPVLDGFETARAMRDLDDGDDVPILAMTAHHDTKELARCTEAGCTTVIQKPLARKALNEMVARHLKPRLTDEIETPAESSSEDSLEGVVLVDPDIQDLVPRFLENQAQNAAQVLELCEQSDFESVRRIGHNMKGTGKGYGFEVISACGASLEQAASREDAEVVTRVAAELSSYLEGLRWQPRP